MLDSQWPCSSCKISALKYNQEKSRRNDGLSCMRRKYHGRYVSVSIADVLDGGVLHETQTEIEVHVKEDQNRLVKFRLCQ